MIVRLACLALLLPGCRYQVGSSLYEYKDVRIPIFENIDERRTHEFDLTMIVSREVSAAGIRVNAKDAAYDLLGTIESFQEPSIVTTGKDDVLVGSVAVTLRLRVVDRKTRKVIVDDRRTEAATFATVRSESTETARQKVFDHLAHWVATKLEKDW